MVALSGGGKLDAALAKIAAKLTSAATVDVGFQSGAKYPDGTPVAMVAAVNEFGAPSRGQPPRPFFRNAIAKNSAKWAPNIATALRANDYDATKALNIVGKEIQEEVQQSIIDLVSPSLAPSTIKAKSRGRVKKIAGVMGPEKPLVDTGVMLRSVTHIVK